MSNLYKCEENIDLVTAAFMENISFPKISSMNTLKRVQSSQIQELRGAFSLLDKDGDGSVSIDELEKVMLDLGYCPTKDELRQMLCEIDVNGDGCFSFAEFLQITGTHDETHDLRQTFKVFDKHGCGYIGAEEVKCVLHCIGEDVSLREIDEMIVEVDTDGDGRIDLEEFISYMHGDHVEDKDTCRPVMPVIQEDTRL